MSSAWLAAIAYVMTFCFERLAAEWKVPPALMGLTLGALGVSLSNLFASAAVARRSAGDMAVGNALASNVFNTCVALGAPWLTASAIRGGGGRGGWFFASRGTRTDETFVVQPLRTPHTSLSIVGVVYIRDSAVMFVAVITTFLRRQMKKLRLGGLLFPDARR